MPTNPYYIETPRERKKREMGEFLQMFGALKQLFPETEEEKRLRGGEKLGLKGEDLTRYGATSEYAPVEKEKQLDKLLGEMDRVRYPGGMPLLETQLQQEPEATRRALETMQKEQGLEFVGGTPTVPKEKALTPIDQMIANIAEQGRKEGKSDLDIYQSLSEAKRKPEDITSEEAAVRFRQEAYGETPDVAYAAVKKMTRAEAANISTQYGIPITNVIQLRKLWLDQHNTLYWQTPEDGSEPEDKEYYDFLKENTPKDFEEFVRLSVGGGAGVLENIMQGLPDVGVAEPDVLNPTDTMQADTTYDVPEGMQLPGGWEELPDSEKREYLEIYRSVLPAFPGFMGEPEQEPEY